MLLYTIIYLLFFRILYKILQVHTNLAMYIADTKTWAEHP